VLPTGEGVYTQPRLIADDPVDALRAGQAFRKVLGKALCQGRENRRAPACVPASIKPDQATSAAIKAAKAVAATSGPFSDWSTTWATETLTVGKVAFEGLTYSNEDSHDHYQVTLPAGYSTTRGKLQQQQIIKAGARLAQILQTIWPD
jgi:hypothetical protein